MSAMRKDLQFRKYTFDLDLGDDGAVRRSYDHRQAEPAHPEPQAAEPAAEPEPEAPPPPPPAPTFSEADMEAARDEAYVAGHTAALQEAEAATERLAAESLHFIAQSLRQMTDAIDEPYHRLNAMATEIAIAVCRRVLPTITARHGTEEVEALLQQVLPTLVDQPRIIVRVHPALSEQVRLAVRPVVEDVGFEGRIMVIDDVHIQPGDARVEWGDGGIERDTPRTWREILDVIDRNITTPAGIAGDFGAAEAEADAAAAARGWAAEGGADDDTAVRDGTAG